MQSRTRILSEHPSGGVEPRRVSRRSLLSGATIATGAIVLLAASLETQRAEAGNMTQQAAGYQPTPKDGKRCDGCSLFQAPEGCKLVAGTISPAGWCRFWVKKA
jgi:hypothetical protein